MYKYWIIFKNSLQTSFAYRTNFFAMLISEGLSLLIMIYLWLSIYHQGNQIGSYSFSSLVYYYFVSKLVILVISSQDFGREVAVAIRDGNFSAYLTKPVSFFWQMVSANLANGIQRLTIFLSLAVLLSVFYLGLPDMTLKTFLVFMLAAIVGYINYILIYFAIGVTIFFVGYVSGLNFLMFGISSFFSGRLVPLDMLPAQYSRIADWLPFQYFVYVPTAIATGKLSSEQALAKIFYGSLWAIGLAIFLRFHYRRGLIKFESYGS
jgi:ABC-2 type transport system permease protein